MDITEAVNGFLAAALWADLTDDHGDNLDDYGIADVAENSRKVATQIVAEFYRLNAADIVASLGVEGYGQRGEWSHDEQVGHDIWLTARGHGVGFWDRELGDIGSRLTQSCDDQFSYIVDAYLYVGEDGQVYIDVPLRIAEKLAPVIKTGDK